MPSPGYLSCAGSTQVLITRGAFTADSVGNKYIEGHEDEVLLQSFAHGMQVPTDPQSGQPAGFTGVRQSGRFTTRVDPGQ